MANAQRAYSDYLYSTAAPQREQRRSGRSDVQVIPGKRRFESAPPISPSLVTLAKMAAVIIVVIAVASFVRIGLASATVNSLMEGDQIESSINDARAYGSSLEISTSMLGSSTALKQSAAALGMIEPAEVQIISLPPDIVAFDEEGNLSLAQSVSNALSIQE